MMSSKTYTLKNLNSLFKSNNSRTSLAIKNIIGSLVAKGGSVLISLLVVPLTINYVNATQYGIWLALSSIIAWFSLFDIGLGNGLKNKLTQALASNELGLAKIYISTTYAILVLLVGVFILVFIAVNQMVTWSSVLSLPAEMEAELRKLISLVFIFFCIQFILQIIIVILTAHQNLSTASLLVFLGNLVSLAIIAVLTRTTQGSLFNLALAFSISPLLVYLLATLFYFKKGYKTIAPSFKHIDFKYSKALMGLGIKFFIIQIAVVILYQTTNLLLMKLYGPDEVTSYNIGYKYFGVIQMFFAIVIAPFWVAFSDAFYKNDITWIQKTIKKLLGIWTLVSIGGLFMLVVSIPVIRLWVGDSVNYKWQNGLALFLYFASSTFGTIFIFFINGTGKIFIQFVTSLISPLLFIPLALYLGKHFGQSGVIYSSIICNFYGILIAPIQYRKIIAGNAAGIWGR
ncbi:lipopolysaccharide biosynthesis protein [Flavihumibacter fluvii]|uniref:lipopolysaccharide biosynthesis protein n=1 Tax=Flavihumibacter fluvii TaxID=2838157 RepID=UPI001BDEE1C9|nr:lipopolysaccharide biosynthesis protein [Flavihumibacter fluvii]ULQ54442.1 lipopolysaccharide biosynthesis protein [Flavihumibacter fluvii]